MPFNAYCKFIFVVLMFSNIHAQELIKDIYPGSSNGISDGYIDEYAVSANFHTESLRLINSCRCVSTEASTAFLFSALPFGFIRRNFLPAKARQVGAKAGHPFQHYDHVNRNRRTQTCDHAHHSSNEKPWRKNRHAHSI